MPTPIFNDMYEAALIRDCSLVRTVSDLRKTFPDASFVGLVPLAKGLYRARVDFMDAIDATENGRRAKARNITTSCVRCGDKYCANAELVQFIIPKSGK